MKIYYIDHSGFAVELEHTVLVFDYYRGDIPDFSPEKQIYVFSSHFHEDHFHFGIYPLFRGYPHVQYVLSRDIKRQYNRGFFLSHCAEPEEYDERTVFLSSRKELCLPLKEEKSAAVNTDTDMKYMDTAAEEAETSICIWSFKSTDCGVAWLVRAEGQFFYHAGDLNWWDWERYTPEERAHWRDAYLQEVDRVAETLLGQQGFCVAAFVVLDGHMAAAEAIRSFDAFARRVPAEVYFPMHFWDHPERVRELCESPCSMPYRERIADTSAELRNWEYAEADTV